jgi:hypothetical protein
MPGLLLHLADDPCALVAEVVLELAHHDLLGLARAQARHSLELAQLTGLLRLQLLARVVEVAPPVLERAVALVEVVGLQLERCLLCAQPFLQPRDLGPPGEQLLLEAVTPTGRPSLGRGGRGLGRWDPHRAGLGGARALHEHHHRHRDPRRDQRRQHDLHVRLLTRRTQRRSQHSVR